MDDSRKANVRHKTITEEPVTSILRPGEIVYDPDNPDREYNEDEEVLAALGYKAEFKREFSLFTTFSVSFAVLGLLPSYASTMYYGLGYAGTAGATWGWIIAGICIECVALGMAEICSSMPTSGGLYYASAVLAPPGYGPLAAWITGWSNWLGQITGAPSVNYGTASMILAAASIQSGGTYVPQNYQVWLMTVALQVIHGIISSMPTRFIGRFNAIGSGFNMLALVVVIIIIPSATNRESQGLPRFNSASDVWGTVYPGTDYPSGISVLMSFLGIIWTCSGYDSAFHLSEECANANVAAPRAIVMTSTSGVVFGWFVSLVVAYTVIDIGACLDSSVGQPFAAYVSQVLPDNVAMAVLALTIIAGFYMGQGCMVAASRVTFAYARDGVFPFSKFLSTVNPVTHTPVNAVLTNMLIGIILLLLVFGGPLAAGALFSIGAIAAFVAFTLPIFIRIFLVGDRFRRGPFHLGRYSFPIGVVACGFVLLMTPIMCLPSTTGADLNVQTMNWTSVVYGGPMTLIMIWWFAGAHKWFKGPKVNVEHKMMDGLVEIQGVDVRGRSGSVDSTVAGQGFDKKAMLDKTKSAGGSSSVSA